MPPSGDPTMRDVFLAIRKIREETPDLAWMLDYPEVAKLLIRRASGRIDDQKFQYELYRTRFWKQTSDAQRQWRTMVSVDPAKAVRQRQQMAARVRQLMGELGVDLDGARIRAKGEPRQGYDLTGRSKVNRIADLALYNGWDETQVTNYLLSLVSWGQEGQTPTGGLAAGMTQIRRLAEQYGVDPRDKRLFRWSRDILSGRDTTEGIEERLRSQARARYSGNETLTDLLDRGGTLEDWFGDYRRIIAEELEIPEAQITMNGRRWRQILHHTDANGRVRPMSQAEVLEFVRRQPEWSETNGAKSREAQMASTLLGAFGRRAA